MEYSAYSSLVDTGLVIALVLIVWRAYREMRSRKYDRESSAELSKSAGGSAA